MRSNATTAIHLARALKAAVTAAKASGALMRRHQFSDKQANVVTRHDIKLELDVRSQKLIEKILRSAFPQVAVLGEEGDTGHTTEQYRWVVDPIDGTVNFAYGIPHACVSIALQGRPKGRGKGDYEDGYQTLVGVVYDPFCDELWTGIRGEPARLNGRIVRVSARNKLKDCIASIGFGKDRESLESSLPHFNRMARKVRKVRMMGSAALGLVYVASGRFDAYIERGIRLWDIAAGGLIIECAGGEFWHEAIDEDQTYRMVASNGRLRRALGVPGAE